MDHFSGETKHNEKPSGEDENARASADITSLAREFAQLNLVVKQVRLRE